MKHYTIRIYTEMCLELEIEAEDRKAAIKKASIESIESLGDCIGTRLDVIEQKSDSINN